MKLKPLKTEKTASTSEEPVEEIQQDLPFVEKAQEKTEVSQSTVSDDESVEVETTVEQQQEIDFAQTEQATEEVKVDVQSEVQTEAQSEVQTEVQTEAEAVTEVTSEQASSDVANNDVQEQVTPEPIVEEQTSKSLEALAPTVFNVALANKVAGKATAPMAKPEPVEIQTSDFVITAMDSESRIEIARSSKTASRADATNSSSAGPTKP